MIDHTDFSLPQPDQEPATAPAAAASPDAPAPMIVVEYRHRSLFARLAPPLLILLSAVLIVYYERRRPVEIVVAQAPKVEPQAEPAKPEQPRPDDRPPVVLPLVVPAPIGDAPPPASEAPAPAGPAARPAGRPAAEMPVSPFEFDPDDGLKPVPPAPAQAPASIPPPVLLPPTEPAAAPGSSSPQPAAANPPAAGPPADPPAAGPVAETPAPAAKPDETRAALEDIQREAVAKENQRQDLEALKPQAQAQLFAEMLAKIDSNRIAFRNELRVLLENPGPTTGAEIENACKRFGRDVPKEVLDAYNRVRLNLPPRITRQAEVEFMRNCGLPEPRILDILANRFHQYLNTRGGPRDRNDVRVSAAKQLLQYPLKPRRSNPATISSDPYAITTRPAGTAAGPRP